VRLCDLEKNFT